MKGFYLVSIPKEILNKEYEGVAKKIKSHILDLNEEGLQTQLFSFEDKKCFFYKILKQLPYNMFVSNRKYQVKFDNTDFFYIRKMAFDFPFIMLLKKIKERNPSCKIILEIPTYPYDNERTKIINIPNKIKDRHNRKKLFQYIDRIVTFSNDEEIFGIPTLKLSNGIDTKHITIKKITDSNNNDINVIAVAMHSFWHGYDRFIEGMGLYYKRGGRRNIIFHIVGDGDDDIFNKYKYLVEKYNIADKVLFHGKKYGEELDHIYDRCDIALDSMGRHRSGVYYNSSLKGKEYAAKGLPIVSGVKTELDNSKNFRYYLRVPADDTPIDIERIIDFYEKTYSVGQYKVINEIREYAENNFDMKICFKPVIEYIKSY